MEPIETKSAAQSLTMVGAAVAAVLAVAQFLGYAVSAEDVRQGTELVEGLVAGAVAVLAFVGRIRASRAQPVRIFGKVLG